MSFYLDDNDDDAVRFSLGGGGGFPMSLSQQKSPRPAARISTAAAAAISTPVKGEGMSEGEHGFICDNCGGEESYLDETSGALVCTECFTQSQTQIAASQTEIEFDDTMMLAGRISGNLKRSSTSKGGSRKKKRRRLEDLDQSAPLPTAEECIIGVQRVLKECVQTVARLSGLPKEVQQLAMKHTQEIWVGYLKSWHEAAQFFGNLYPEVRLSFRDLFLPSNLKNQVLRTLAHNATKKLRSTLASKVADSTAYTASTSDHQSYQATTDLPETLAPIEYITGMQDGRSDDEGSGDDDGDNMKTTGDIVRKSQSQSSLFQDNNAIVRMVRFHLRNVKKKVLGRKATTLLFPPSMEMVAAILAFAYSPFGVTCHDISKWIENGKLSLINAFPLLTVQERKKLKSIKSFFRISDSPKANKIQAFVNALQVSSGYVPKKIITKKINSARQQQQSAARQITPSSYASHTLTPLAVPLILARTVAELGFSQLVLDSCLALMGLPILPQSALMCFTNKGSGSGGGGSRRTWLPKNMTCCRSDKIVSMVELLSVIVIACQYIRRWENHWYTVDYSSTLKGQKTSCVIPRNEEEARRLSSAVSSDAYLTLFEDQYGFAHQSHILNDAEEMERRNLHDIKTYTAADSEVFHEDATNTRVVPAKLLHQNALLGVPPRHPKGILWAPGLELDSQQTKALIEGNYNSHSPSLGALVEYISKKMDMGNPREIMNCCHEMIVSIEASAKRRITHKEKRKHRRILMRKFPMLQKESKTALNKKQKQKKRSKALSQRNSR